MQYSVYLTNNNPETLDRLTNESYYVCPCCRFYNVTWIHLFIREYEKGQPLEIPKLEFHGIGNGCEEECDGMCPEKCITCSIKEGFSKRNICIFNDINDMLKFIEKVIKL